VKLWGQGVVLRNEVTGAEIAARNRLRVRGQQFILSRIDARNGALGLVPDFLDGVVVSSDFPVFAPNHGRIHSQFLNWMSKTAGFVDLCKAASEGTTNRVRLKEHKFLAFKIPLPRLDEQRRIVARIEQLAAKIQEARTLRRAVSEDSLPAMRNALFAPAFEGGWQHVSLDEVCSLITDGTHQTPQYVDDGYMFLSAQNVKPFNFMPEMHRRVSFEDYRACVARAKPRKGDILMTRVGAMIGEAALIDRDLDFAFYVSLALIRPTEETLLPEFLVHWLNSPGGLSQSRGQTLGKGHSQGNLNLKLLRRFDVPLPPITIQQRIVVHLDALQAKVDALKKLQAETATELDALFPSILDRAFRGEL
jgi:type I restriction enzyme S subunit